MPSYSAGIPFQATLLNRLDESVVEALAWACGLLRYGQRQARSRSPGSKESALSLTTIGPWAPLAACTSIPIIFGIDGAFELSAAGTVYSVVRKMGDNADLAGLALVGAMGDRQAMIGANRSILEEALTLRAVEVRPGLKMSEDGPVEQVFQAALSRCWTLRETRRRPGRSWRI